MTVHVLRSAHEDILKAARFYEKQEKGLGERVIAFLETEVMKLGETAGIHPVHRGFYRAVVQGAFPYYLIYYTVDSKGVHVRAILDHRRNPRKIRQRLRDV